MAATIQEKITEFFQNYPLKQFASGQALITAKEEPAGIFYIVEGQVKQYDISATGTEVMVNIFNTGAFFPMSWALNKTPNDYFFSATAPTTVRQAPASEVVTFLQANPDVLLDLLSRVFRGTDALLRQVVSLRNDKS